MLPGAHTPLAFSCPVLPVCLPAFLLLHPCYRIPAAARMLLLTCYCTTRLHYTPATARLLLYACYSTLLYSASFLHISFSSSCACTACAHVYCMCTALFFLLCTFFFARTILHPLFNCFLPRLLPFTHTSLCYAYFCVTMRSCQSKYKYAGFFLFSRPRTRPHC
jgi:hypothetical protein